MDTPLGSLGGAAGGMADAVSGLIEQRLRQTKVAGDIAQAQAQLQETIRAHQADELNRQQQTQNVAAEAANRAEILKQAAQARTDATNEAANRNLAGVLKTVPKYTQFTPAEQAKAQSIGVPAGQFSTFQPASMGMSTPTGEVGPTPDQPAGMWLGTESAEEAQAKLDAAAAKAGAAGSIEKDEHGNYIRVAPDNSVTPIIRNGQPVRAYQPPVQPVVLNTETGPSLLNRGTGSVRPILGPDNQPVGYKPSGQEQNRQDMATRVASHFPEVEQQLKEAEDRGLLGPMAGRTFTDFMAGQVGSTGNAADDDLLGDLRMNLGLLRSGVASLHGRAGANAGIADKIEKKMDEGHMSYAELSGGLRALKNWATKYAAPPGRAASSSPSTGASSDDLLNRLNNRRRQQQQ
jgi:hypothetical protein